MYRAGYGLGLLLVLPLMVRADEPIPQEMLQHLKAATVFVKVRLGELQGSGSGFLMMAEGTTGLIVTNDHVVSVPAELRRRLGNPSVQVVFHSGRKNELVARAEILATDPVRDLAVLRVKDVQDLPKPLNHTEKVTLVETMGVYVLGFPFGEILSTSKGNPAITIGKGTVSSIREDDRGELKVVQIDGDLNPGNSGGPVVDAKGRLIGVAVAKVRGTNIGLAIPTGELTKMLNGRLGGLSLRTLKTTDEALELQVELKFIDPLEKITKATVLVAPYDAAKERPKADEAGNWPPLSDAQTVELKIGEQKGMGTFTFKMKTKGTAVILLQPIYTTGEGRTHYAQPVKHTANVGKALTAGGAAEGDPDRGGMDRPPPARGTSPRGAREASRARPKPANLPTKIAGGPPKPLGDPVITPVPLGSGQGPACLCWSADGKAFYHLDGEGTVRRVSFPELKEEKALDTGKKCSWLSVSARGPLLTVTDAQEM
jgi:hypothetical protein